MAVVIIEPSDLEPFADIGSAKAQAMIDDALAMAALVAPCLTDDDFTQALAARAILRGAILRWNDAGSGAVTQQSAGPFQQSIDTRTQRRNMFWPSEIEQLRSLCAGDKGGAFSVDTAPCVGSVHLPWCNLMFGATYCSCGADIAGQPIYETP